MLNFIVDQYNFDTFSECKVKQNNPQTPINRALFYAKLVKTSIFLRKVDYFTSFASHRKRFEGCYTKRTMFLL